MVWLVLRELKIRFGRFAKIRIRIRELKFREKRTMIFARNELRIRDFFERIKFVNTNFLFVAERNETENELIFLFETK